MNSRLRLAPPKAMLAQRSGSRIWPIRSPSGERIWTPSMPGPPAAAVHAVDEAVVIDRAAGGAFVAADGGGAVRGIGEPDGAVLVHGDVVGRVQLFAIPGVGQDGDRSVELVADDAAVEMLAGDLAA